MSSAHSPNPKLPQQPLSSVGTSRSPVAQQDLRAVASTTVASHVGTQETSEKLSPSSKVCANAYPSWSPRFWHGMRMGTWWRLLAKNRFRIAPGRLPIALGVSLFSPLNDVLSIWQSALHGRRIRETSLKQAPIFILGHWRSGTTLMHEMLVNDVRFASPSTYQCFAPWHFVVTERLMVRFGSFLLPKKRPMDNMEAGWQLPQEDEFALMNLGVPSPYLRIAFPQTQTAALEYLDLQELTPQQRLRWREKLQWFLKALSYHHGGKRLVLKSPPHTGRMAELAELFPEAKFIHLTRDPRKLFASTMRLWKSLEEVQALQQSRSDDEMRDYVSECLNRMYHSFEAARSQVDSSRLVDVRYEDLVADPIGTLRGLYERLQLGDFAPLEERLQQRQAQHAVYRTNDHHIDPEMERDILDRWGDYAARYGYLG